MLKNCRLRVAMLKRFVVVPAFPAGKEHFPRRIGFPRASEAGFDLYDTQEKTRLILRLPTRADAEYECTNRNNPPDTNSTDAAGSA